MTADLVNIEMMAHGGSVVEIRKADGRWQVVRDSQYNRRITAETEMEITGPAAGHALLQTSADQTGTRVLGMLNNCAGGVTPWGTWLSGEENFNGYFAVAVPEEGLPVVGPEESYEDPQARTKAVEERQAALVARRDELVGGLENAAALKRYGVPGGWYAWNKFHDRFDVIKEPNESNRFGWVVEIDPNDPNSMPKKRTALGRMKHEGAETIVNKDGRVVVYMGDDERFDYVYKFVPRAARREQPRSQREPPGRRHALPGALRRRRDRNLDSAGPWRRRTDGGQGLRGSGQRSDPCPNGRPTRSARPKMDRPEDISAAR
jgi:secreted PhoX family phosphatase